MTKKFAFLIVAGLHLKEFFLLLSSTGLAYRRCSPVPRVITGDIEHNFYGQTGGKLLDDDAAQSAPQSDHRAFAREPEATCGNEKGCRCVTYQQELDERAKTGPRLSLSSLIRSQ